MYTRRQKILTMRTYSFSSIHVDCEYSPSLMIPEKRLLNFSHWFEILKLTFESTNILIGMIVSFLHSFNCHDGEHLKLYHTHLFDTIVFNLPHIQLKCFSY